MSSQHKLICQALQLAQKLEKQVKCVLEKTKAGLKEKCHNLMEAKARLANLQHKMQCACQDLCCTKQAAHCACEAAKAACSNARRRRHIMSNDTAVALANTTTISR